MPGFKIKRAKEIDGKILEILKSEHKPVSTREMAIRTKLSWHTIINHALRLQIDGKIDGFKISNINVWVIKK